MFVMWLGAAAEGPEGPRTVGQVMLEYLAFGL